jgi:NTE family protein
MAVKLYEDQVFHHASFADLQRKDGPLILINASDLGYGVRFSFIQEYFNLLCSDISSFSVARAVAASSSVPVLFNPVVVENYQDCKHARPPWLQSAEQRLANDPQMMQVVSGLDTYFDLDNRQYAHFVDGGITDNLGLRAIYEIIEVAGGAKTLIDKLGRETPRNVVVISVNASTDPEPVMDHSNKQPSLEETINAVTDVQLHRYNAATLELMKHSVSRWADELSTDEKTVAPYFIQVGFRDVAQPKRRRFFNRIPTSFSLTDEQVDELIITGRQLLRSNADFQRFLSNLGGARVTGRETSL